MVPKITEMDGAYMIRIALVEDDKNYIETLKNYLHTYEKKCNQKIKVTVFMDGEDIVTGYKADYDIILMDIEMMFMNGMTAAEKIREMDSEVIIIFITNMPQYVMEGYKVDALDYVIKPLTYFALSQRIDRALNRLHKRTKRYIMIALKGGMQKVDVSRIKYIEVQNHDAIIYTVDEIFTTRETLTNLEDLIGSKAFFRCNKCYLVNLEYVDGIQNYDIAIGKDIIQVSRSKKKEFMDNLNDYINEVSK